MIIYITHKNDKTTRWVSKCVHTEFIVFIIYSYKHYMGGGTPWAYWIVLLLLLLLPSQLLNLIFPYGVGGCWGGGAYMGCGWYKYDVVWGRRGGRYDEFCDDGVGCGIE